MVIHSGVFPGSQKRASRQASLSRRIRRARDMGYCPALFQQAPLNFSGEVIGRADGAAPSGSRTCLVDRLSPAARRSSARMAASMGVMARRRMSFDCSTSQSCVTSALSAISRRPCSIAAATSTFVNRRALCRRASRMLLYATTAMKKHAGRWPCCTAARTFVFLTSWCPCCTAART